MAGSASSKKSSSSSSTKKRKMFSGGSSSSSSKKSKSKSGGSSGGGSSNSKPSKAEVAAEKLFTIIADEDDPTIATMDGIVALCEKLDLDPFEDIRVLVLLYKLGAKEKPAQISKQEFVSGCVEHNVTSVETMKKFIPSLDVGFMDQAEFKDFYKFCFQFNRQSTHKTLDKDLVDALLKLTLKGRVGDDRLDTFCKFLESQQSYTRITFDQWTSFLDFCYECEDLSTYDESMSAWPVLIDEYVEYMEEQQKAKK
eukprot:CAMPEP_0113491018 /NCGR_PEP_ID=MMETSP0014_2-20120614/27343_1 /TAXON_ID=2857 /ORGANISM="Nitzschia sp." /LENGTH=253 /DNA_ID=CAMNT_0000384803 /DNA_START=128 /DNA_END=889 /DNA_ORIENTATION=- /assembly_acc=CAM_ASM_000159